MWWRDPTHHVAGICKIQRQWFPLHGLHPSRQSSASSRPDQTMKQKYPWPASLLDERDMEVLFHAKQKSGKPITLLIKEAINQMYLSQ